MSRHRAHDREVPADPGSVGRHRGARTLAVFVALCLGLPLLVAAPAGADDVDDLSARADEIAHELMDLRGRMSEIGEQFNQSQIRRDELRVSKADLADRVRAAEFLLAVRSADAARYALSAYAGVGEDDVLSMALDGRQWDLSRRAGYASISIGDRQQIVDELSAAQQVNDDLSAALADAEDADRRVAADLERQQAEATRLLDEQEALHASVQGDLADAVAQRQLELAAAEQAGPGVDDGTPDGAAARTRGPSAPSITGTGAAHVARGPDPTVAPGATRPPATSPPGSVGPSGPPATSPPTAPPVTSPPPPPVVPPSTGGGSTTVANAAISQLGVPYSWGGGNASGPSMGFGPGAGIVGFDCSGLTLYAWARVGVYLPHSAQMQYDLSAKVSLSNLAPGDLVFYGSSSRSIDHVSVYVGGGQVVHAPNSRSVVQYGPVQLWPGYYPWIGAGRPG